MVQKESTGLYAAIASFPTMDLSDECVTLHTLYSTCHHMCGEARMLDDEGAREVSPELYGKVATHLMAFATSEWGGLWVNNHGTCLVDEQPKVLYLR